MTKKLVLIDHDGAIDDFLATILLMRMEAFQPLGAIVTPADCYIEPAVSVPRKILDLMECYEVPVAKSTVRGINAFPPIFRRDSVIIDRFPILNQTETIRTPLVEESGQVFTVKVLQEAPEPVTLIVTGPMTTVATALDLAPEIETKIKEIVWMGGALNVSGNVEKAFAPEHDGSAEWNVYWDPIAADRVWQTNIPIVLCPLDLTNNVPVTSKFTNRLAKQRHYPLSDLAGLCYALASPQDYYCWDIVATTYLARPEFYQVSERETTIVTTGMSQGRIKIQSRGRKIGVMETVDRERFFAYLLEQFAA